MVTYTFPKELIGQPLPFPVKEKEKEKESLQFKLAYWVKTGQFSK